MASGPGQGLKRALQDEMENGLVLMILKVADEVWCFFFFEQKKKKNRKEREGGWRDSWWTLLPLSSWRQQQQPRQDVS